MKFNELIKSKNVRRGIEIVVAVLILMVVFGAGVFVGVEKTSFSYRWGENYFRNFAGPPSLFVDRGYMNAHGTTGPIIKVDGNAVIIKASDGEEKNIEVTNQTLIKKGPADIPVSQLRTGDYVVVIGSPNSEGEIEAQLVRVTPLPPPGN